MRVTFASSYDKVIQNINAKKRDLDRLTTMASSGKRLLSPQDDPFAWSQASNIKQGLREIDAISTNLDFAVSWNESTDAALSQLSDLLIDAQDLAMSSIKVSTPEEQQARSDEMTQILEQLKEIANTQHNDLYIFSGWGFSDDGSGNMICSASKPPFDSAYAYQGDTDSLKVRTSKSALPTAINVDGEAVFEFQYNGSTVNIFETIDDLSQAIQDSITTGDVEPIQDLLTVVNAAREHISGQQSLVGSRLSTLEHKQNTLSDLKITEQERYSEVAEADYLEVFTQLQQKQTAFQAALQVTAMIDDLNLLDFL